MSEATVLVTTFNRDCLLQLGLTSIRQWNPDVKILVLNDGQAGNVEHICKYFNADYLFTGAKKHAEWRVPGYALNIGIKHVNTPIVVLTCAEILHITDCLTPMIEAVRKDSKALAIPHGKDDQDNRYMLRGPQTYEECPNLKTELPFLMAIWRENLLAVGGFDEDLTGQSFDDDSLVECLLAYGCHYTKVDAKCLHLYHPRYCYDKQARGRWQYNKDIYEKRKGIIVRNQNREWGVL